MGKRDMVRGEELGNRGADSMGLLLDLLTRHVVTARRSQTPRVARPRDPCGGLATRGTKAGRAQSPMCR